MAEDVATLKERTSIEEVVREHVTLRPAGSRLDEGAVPLPRREDPVVQRQPDDDHCTASAAARAATPSRSSRRSSTSPSPRPIERLAHADRHGAALRGRRHQPGATTWASAAALAADRGAPGRPGVLRRPRPATPATPRPGPAATSCARAGSTARRPRCSGSGIAPRGGEDLVAAPAGQGLPGRGGRRSAASPGAGRRGLYDRFRGRLVWPIRDITGDMRGVRRPPALRRRPDRGEVPQHLGDPDLQEVDGALRARRGEEVDRPRPQRGHRRGLHRRDGLPPVRHRERRSRPVARRSASTTSRCSAGSCATRPTSRRPRSSSPSTATRPGRRPRCGRSARTSAGRRSRSSPWPKSGMDPCELRQAKGADAVRRLVDDAVPMFEFAVRTTIGAVRPRHRRGPGPGHAGGRADRRPASATSRCGPEYVRVLAGLLGVEVEQVTAEVARAGEGRQPRPRLRDPPPPRAAPRRSSEPTADELRDALPRPDLRDPVVFAERQLLQVVLQQPGLLEPGRARPARRHVVQRAGAPVGLGRRRHGRAPRRLDRGVDRRGGGGRPCGGPAAGGRAGGRPAAGHPGPRDRAAQPAVCGLAGHPAPRGRADPQIADAVSQLRRQRQHAGARPGWRNASWACGFRGSSASSPTCATSRRADAVVDQGTTFRRPARRGPRGAAGQRRRQGAVGRTGGRLAGLGGGRDLPPGARRPRPAGGEALVWSRPWHEVDAGSWSREASTLTVTWADRRRPGQWRLGEGMRERVFLQTLRERVQATVVLGEDLPAAGRRTGRAVIRQDLRTRRPRRAGGARPRGPGRRGGRPLCRPARWPGCASRSGCRSRSRDGRSAGRFREPVLGVAKRFPRATVTPTCERGPL